MGRFVAEADPGDVLEWEQAGAGRRHVVVARGHGRYPRLLTITADGSLERISSQRLPVTTAVVGHLDIPMPPEPRRAGYRNQVAEMLASWSPGDAAPRFALAGAGDESGAARCAHLESHLEAARSIRRRERRIEGLLRRQTTGTEGMVPLLNDILRLLEDWGYVDGWTLTAAGRRLRLIHNELDLLLAESLETALFTGLAPAEIAALTSIFTYEPRAEPSAEQLPTPRLDRVVYTITDVWERLAAAEEQAGLERSRAPEAGFADIAYRWANGSELRGLFEENTSGVGDFVRNCRQLIDLMRQMAEVAPELEQGVRAAITAVDRGVVAAAGAI